MNYSLNSLARFFKFLDSLEGEAYAEAPTPLHDNVSKQSMDHLFATYQVPAHARVLDVGCGQGVALTLFRQRGCIATGVTLNDTDVAICCAQEFDVHKMDQSFLEFEDSSFDLIWARHVVEHSIMPYYTLTEFRRVLKPGGFLYLEAPGINTLGHEQNPNHYSVLGQEMWVALLERSGFQVMETMSYFLKTLNGEPDEFWGFYCLTTETPC